MSCWPLKLTLFSAYQQTVKPSGLYSDYTAQPEQLPVRFAAGCRLEAEIQLMGWSAGSWVLLHPQPSVKETPPSLLNYVGTEAILLISALRKGEKAHFSAAQVYSSGWREGKSPGLLINPLPPHLYISTSLGGRRSLIPLSQNPLLGTEQNFPCRRSVTDSQLVPHQLRVRCCFW